MKEVKAQIVEPSLAPTLKQALDEYLSFKKLKPRTTKQYIDYLNRCVHGFLNTPIDQITRGACLKRHQELRQIKSSYATTGGNGQADLTFRIIRTVFNFAIAYYDLKISNPVTAFSVLEAWAPRVARTTHIKWYDLGRWYREIAALRAADRDFYLMLLFTGFRFNEMARLEWKEVDLKHGFITLSGERVKNGKAHIIPLSTHAIEILKKMKSFADGPYVFAYPTTRKPFFKKPHHKIIGQRLGFACYPHALRRTFATLARHQCGADYETVKRCLNHFNGDITDRYIQQEPESLRATFQAVADFFFKTVESGKPFIRMSIEQAKASTTDTEDPAVKTFPKQSAKLTRNALVIMGPIEQAIIEGKILASIRSGRDTKKNFYKKIGAHFRLNSREMARILQEMENRQLIMPFQNPGPYIFTRYAITDFTETRGRQ